MRFLGGSPLTRAGVAATLALLVVLDSPRPRTSSPPTSPRPAGGVEAQLAHFEEWHEPYGAALPGSEVDRIWLAVYEVSGRLQALLADGPHAAGTHERRWDAD